MLHVVTLINIRRANYGSNHIFLNPCQTFKCKVLTINFFSKMKKLITILCALCVLSFSVNAQVSGTFPNYQVGESTFTVDCAGFVLVDLDENEVTRFKVWDGDFNPVDLWVGDGTFLPEFYDLVNSMMFGGLITSDQNVYYEIYLGEGTTPIIFNVSEILKEFCPETNPCPESIVTVTCDPLTFNICFGDTPNRVKGWDFTNNILIDLDVADGDDIPDCFTNVGIFSLADDGNFLIEVYYNDYECREVIDLSAIFAAECDDCEETEVTVDCTADGPVVCFDFPNSPNQPIRIKGWDFSQPGGPIIDITSYFDPFCTAGIIEFVPEGNYLVEVYYENEDCYEVINVEQLLADAGCEGFEFPGVKPDEDDERLGNNDEKGDERSDNTSFSDRDFKVFPNPASDKFTINLASSKVASSIEVYDLNGRMVHNQAQVFETYQIDVSSWNSGIYLVRAISEGEINTQKIQVIR